MSAHSLRKKLQTDLEKARVNSNWINQILGIKLINSRDAYSLPTDEELREAYAEAYQHIRVYPINKKTIETTKPAALTQTEIPTNEHNRSAKYARSQTTVSKRLQIRNGL